MPRRQPLQRSRARGVEKVQHDGRAVGQPTPVVMKFRMPLHTTGIRITGPARGLYQSVQGRHGLHQHTLAQTGHRLVVDAGDAKLQQSGVQRGQRIALQKRHIMFQLVIQLNVHVRMRGRTLGGDILEERAPKARFSNCAPRHTPRSLGGRRRVADCS